MRERLSPQYLVKVSFPGTFRPGRFMPGFFSPVSLTITAMQGLRAQRWTHWVGIMLILMSLLAPTVSHAVRNAHGSTGTPPDSAVWCSPLTLFQSVGTAAAADTSGSDQTPASDHACGYCVSASLNIGIPVMPTPTGVAHAMSAMQLPTPERRAQGATPPQQHRARAPPVSI
jgi:hypothetical protein